MLVRMPRADGSWYWYNTPVPPEKWVKAGAIDVYWRDFDILKHKIPNVDIEVLKTESLAIYYEYYQKCHSKAEAVFDTVQVYRNYYKGKDLAWIGVQLSWEIDYMIPSLKELIGEENIYMFYRRA